MLHHREFACLLAIFLIRSVAPNEGEGGPVSEMLSLGRLIFSGCPLNSGEFLGCVKSRMLRGLDRLIDRDVLLLPYGVKLINDRHLEDGHVNNGTSFRERGGLHSAPVDTDFLRALLSRAVRLMHTHTVQIPLPMYVNVEGFEGRRRHHHRHRGDMMGIFLFGVMAMTVIAIPLGFQFLAVLGGKALMLAKLALILTSIQGLKKVATSNLSYGLYHTNHHHRPFHYDWRRQPGDVESPGLFDNFDLTQPDAPHVGVDPIRSRIMMPRPGHHSNIVAYDPQADQV